MARGAAQARKRPRAQQQKPKSKPTRKQQSWEDQLFFARLRRHTKWMFVLLALVFAVGFVAFGVGSGSTGVGGIGDIFNSVFGKSSSGIDSRISDDQKKLAANPGDTQTAIDLSTLYQQKQQSSQAIAVLKKTSNVKPKNLDVLNAIAGIYRNEASSAKNAAADAQNALASRAVTPPGLDMNSSIGQAFAGDPLSQDLRTKATTAFNNLATAYAKAETAYKDVAVAAKGTPQEPNAQLALAGVAIEAVQITGQTSDIQVAIDAYKRYLKLEPNGVSANQARQTLKQLEPFLKRSKRQ
jgi:tetratricopeptide (TPR) repeat protein